MTTDIQSSSPFSAVSYAADTNSSAHQHDVMDRYAALMTVTNDAPANNTFTAAAISIGADTILKTAHGYRSGLTVTLTTTVAMPTGLTNTATYYASAVTANYIGLATSRANAVAGTLIDLTVADGGTITIVPTALAGLDLHLAGSIDNVTYIDIAGSTTTAAGSTLTGYTSVNYNYVRAELTLTTGQVTSTVTIRSLGDRG